MMSGTKPIYASKTIWGGLMFLVAALLKLFGFDLDEQLQSDVAGWIESAWVLVAAGLVLWGRIKATRRIEGTPPPPVNGIKQTLALLCLVPALAVVSGGCSQLERMFDPDLLDADAERLRAVEPVIFEHVERHPEQAQTWEDFLSAWRDSVESRGQ